MADDDELSSVPVDEFDAGTRITCMRDGSVHLTLGLMPPSWWGGTNERLWEAFHSRLEEAAGTPVEGADKELFVVQEPLPDTVQRLRAFLLRLREEAHPDRR